MFEEFVGREVQISTGLEGELREFGYTLISYEGTVIHLKDVNNNPRVINTANVSFSSIELEM
ncbi:hypothetical protein CJF42_22360 [Pseudoalteromonas sp. NBT06-2]|uniref:hypothetical protein n=1 Tax=Pseudoalteromonas sp. NBT06-2 TaxID=2025950 RepID=UPI000BA66C28|nr:hypothetical protein [Pseudoalteromonas sp. NBT06-2]PAJ72223.1 hypothetical protein CJF42_22360 [Pseudoalteromonas sp. NBT06-2]